MLKIFSLHFILPKAQNALQACAFGLPILQKPKAAVCRVPIASRSDLTEGSQSRCNWHPANSSFGLLKDRQPKGTCLKGNLNFEAIKVWGKNFEYHLAKVWGVELKIFSPHFICPKA